MIAIIPAAGLGKRMEAVTGGAPKELLPLAGRTLLQWNLDEARAVEVSKIVVVSSPSKPELTATCEGVLVVMQERAEGLAFAVGLAGARDAALILLPDTIFYPASPLSRVAAMLEAGVDIVLPLEEVSLEEVSNYGIVEISKSAGLESGVLQIVRIVEKPLPIEAPSRWAIAGRFGLSARALARVADLASEGIAPSIPVLHGADGAVPSGEQHLPPLVNLLIQEGFTGVGLPLKDGEKRFDCGSPGGYERARSALGEAPGLID